MFWELTYLFLQKHHQREYIPSNCKKSKSFPNVCVEVTMYALVLTNKLKTISSDEQRHFEVKKNHLLSLPARYSESYP